jgi:hypothetical protein
LFHGCAQSLALALLHELALADQTLESLKHVVGVLLVEDVVVEPEGLLELLLVFLWDCL